MTQYFRYHMNCNANCVINEISLSLKSNHPYFYLASESPIPLNFLDDQEMFVPIIVKSVELLSTFNGYIPLNNYKMKLEVTDGAILVLSSDVIIHVVESVPTLPVPG